MKFRRLLGTAITGVALAGLISSPAAADTVVQGDNVTMILYGSGYHVSKARITEQGGFQGPAEYEFTYWATTGPNKTAQKICGGDSSSISCLHDFSINATYAHNVGIRSCGSIIRVSTNQTWTACKNW